MRGFDPFGILGLHKSRPRYTRCRLPGCSRSLFSRNEQEAGLCANCQLRLSKAAAGRIRDNLQKENGDE